MNYYLLTPEVAGGIGDESELIYEDGRIKEVTFLEYRFFGWEGDELLTTHPCFIVTDSLKEDIIYNNLKGVNFKNISMTFSEDFYDLCEDIKVPQFVQLLCDNNYEENLSDLNLDFYINRYKELIVSEKALNVLRQHKFDICNIEKCN